MANQQPDLYGRYELIKLPALGQTLKAKMDTGAMTASLSAKDIEPFKRDGEEWVRFRLAVEGAEDTVYEHPLVRIAEIKRSEGTRLNSSHVKISYAVFCLKKKKDPLFSCRN